MRHFQKTMDDWTPVVVHRSNPLPVLLRRFNVYSNNDIIRVAVNLGGPGGLEAFLEQRLALSPEQMEIETASGEKVNRLTARTGVRLMRAFVETAGKMGLAPWSCLSKCHAHHYRRFPQCFYQYVFHGIALDRDDLFIGRTWLIGV